jgi:hypothetical protein
MSFYIRFSFRVIPHNSVDFRGEGPAAASPFAALRMTTAYACWVAGAILPPMTRTNA